MATGLVKAVLVDSWGTGIAFDCSPDGHIIIRSAGPDRVFNAADDITEGQS